MKQYYKVKMTVWAEMVVYCEEDDLADAVADGLDMGEYEVENYELDEVEDLSEWDEGYREDILRDEKILARYNR